jgi:hypothetical protein
VALRGVSLCVRRDPCKVLVFSGVQFLTRQLDDVANNIANQSFTFETVILRARLRGSLR